jgi:choline kinase
MYNGEEKTNAVSLSKGLGQVISKNEIEAKAEEFGIHIMRSAIASSAGCWLESIVVL